MLNNKVEQTVLITTEMADLKGDLVISENAKGLVLFAHGSGSSV